MLAEGATKEEKLKTKEKVDKNVLESLEDILHGSPIAEAKHDIEELKEKVIEHTEVRTTSGCMQLSIPSVAGSH